MPKYYAEMEVSPKEGMPDPVSVMELRKLQLLFPDAIIGEFTISKLMSFEIAKVDSLEEAEETVHKIAGLLLVQPTLEDYKLRTVQESE